MDPSNKNDRVSIDASERFSHGEHPAVANSESFGADNASAFSRRSHSTEIYGSDWPGMLRGDTMKLGENGEEPFLGNLKVAENRTGKFSSDIGSDSPSENSGWIPKRSLNWERDERTEAQSINGGQDYIENEIQEIIEESQFEQVSLEDSQERNVMLASIGQVEIASKSPASQNLDFEDTSQSNSGPAKEVTPDEENNMRGNVFRSPARSSNYSPQSFSSSSHIDISMLSLDSGSAFASPISSPSGQKSKLVLPDAPPELLHLIDCAIHDLDSSIMERLRRIVCGEDTTLQGRENEDISQLVVDVLFAKIGGVRDLNQDGENFTPNVMLSAEATVVAASIIPWLPHVENTDIYMSPRTRLVKGMVNILKSCTRNRTMSSRAGLLRALLLAADIMFTKKGDGMSKCQNWDASPFYDCLELLGAHSLSVFDLRGWLQLITDAIPTGRALNLTLALEKATSGKETEGPAYSFEFDGESSGLLGSGESRWPFSNGYAFATWLYIESFADTLNTAATAAAIAAAAAAKSGKSSAMSAAAAASALAGEGTAHMPRLFSFLSADNQGVEAYFHGQFLVVESGSGKGKKASLHFTHAFKPQCWYFIGLEHVHRQTMLGKSESELKLYVNGRLYESRPFEFPRISKPLAFCCIGTNPPPTIAGLQRRRRQCPLFAEMGPVYIFKEPIGHDQMARLAKRGGDTVPSFGNGAGLLWSATNQHAMALAEESFALDAEIEPKIHLLYHPKLLIGRSCPDASPAGTAGTHRRPADVLGHVHVAARVRPIEALWAMAEGGPMSLLPLTVSAMDSATYEPVSGETSISFVTSQLSAPIFRMIASTVQHPGNSEELCRAHAPQVLAQLLRYLLKMLSLLEPGKVNAEARDEELVAAIVSLCQSPHDNIELKVQLFSNLLLDLKMWSRCSYGLQKKLLSSLADMVFTEAIAMRAANAVQVLLDGCRRCYWLINEPDSVDMFAVAKSSRPAGELNALVDELLVIIELLVGSSTGPMATDDVRCLIQFVLDCPQSNQVTRVLHLIYRLVVQPNTSRATMFAETFIYCGGIEMLIALLQKEAVAGEGTVLECSSKKNMGNIERKQNDHMAGIFTVEGKQDGYLSRSNSECTKENIINDQVEDELKQTGVKSSGSEQSSTNASGSIDSQKMSSAKESFTGRSVGGISFSITADSARNNFNNVDSGDGVVVGIVSLLGALVAGGQVKFSSSTTSVAPLPGVHSGNTLSDEINHSSSASNTLLLFALQKAFQAAPQRLMTDTVYAALLGAVINTSSSEDSLNLYDSDHRFEHISLLLVLLRSLPYAQRALQVRAIQDILFLACSHPENRSTITSMSEWPEWLLEVLISNFEMASNKVQTDVGIGEIEDLVHNFLSIMLEHSMRQKDGWKIMSLVLMLITKMFTELIQNKWQWQLLVDSMVIDREFLLRVSFMEIYNEEIKDLLCPENCKLEVREIQERGVFVAGLKELIVNSPQQVLDILQFGEVNRHFGGTNMNANSSRSHAIFRMVIESKRKSIQSTTVVVDSDVVQVSTLHMVDLAGFERISKTGAGGFRLREGTYINKSLVTLSNVIKKLSDGVGSQGGHIPYRDSKLTRILQSVLGGNAKMSIICNVSPGQAHVEETRGTLLFASRAKKVTMCARLNEVVNDAALLKRQTKEIEELRKKLKGKLAEDMDKEVLKLRNDLLKIELEREKLAIQLEEEKKSQAEKERLIKEHEQTIENLSTMVWNCSSNINTSEGTMQKACRLHPSEETITIRSDTDCVLARFEDLLCGAENKCYQSTNEEFIPPNFVNVADDDTWIGLNNVTTVAEPAFFESPMNDEYTFRTMETTSSREVDRTELRLQKLLEENAQLKAQLAEERKTPNLYNSFIVKILELQDGERRIRDVLKETWMQLLCTQENEQNLRKENISLLLSKTRAEMLLDQIRDQLEFLEKILAQASSEHAELHLYSTMVKDMVLTATKHARSIGDAYACLQLLHDDSSLERTDSCLNFNEILDIGQEDMCNIADPDELVMKLSKKDSEISHMHYETDPTVNDLTFVDPSFDLFNLQGWGRHLTPEEREMAFEVFKRFCKKMGRAQLLEVKLAAAELHVVELKIEVDDLRARLQVLDVNSPSHIKIELQKLRSQCDCYKKEIELLMEQFPTADQEAYKRNEIAKIQKENTKAQLRLKKLERQISHVKKWRKELRRLKEVDRERDTLLSRLEETLKRNRSLQQELIMLKEKTEYCSTTRRTTSKDQSAKKSHQVQGVAVLESHVLEAEPVEVDALCKQEMDKEIGCVKLPSSSARSQTRPPLKIIDVNREKSAKSSQPNYLNESVCNGITNKENILIFKT